jgi:glycosyltransferase involved in cell wall biosynthesis
VNLEQVLSPSPGGVGRYAAKLVSNLVALGVSVEPVVARHSAEEVKAAWQEFGLSGGPAGLASPASAAVPAPRVLRLPRAALYDSWHLLGWPPLSSDKDVDLLHAPSLAVPPKRGKPLVVSVHDAAPWLYPESFTARGRWFHNLGVRAAARRADKVITGTEAAAAELREYTRLPSSLISVVAYGVDPNDYRSGEEPVTSVLRRFGLDESPYVLWVGSLEPRKGIGVLVGAMARLAAGTNAARAGKGTAAGRGTALALAGYAGWQNARLIPPGQRDQLGASLHQLGPVTEEELQALYAGATVFAFPSFHEGFGLPVLEAMAAGTPVVASDIPALREVAGDAAVLVPPGDVEQWAGALEDLLDSASRRSELAEAGRRRAALFPWARTAAATLEVYEQLVG